MSKIIITNKDKLTSRHKNEHSSYEYFKYEVTPRSEFSQVYICFYEIPPLKYNYPFHYHVNNTEAFYIISGSGKLVSAEGDFDIASGDVIVCPPGQTGAHQLLNTSDTLALTYMDFDTTHSPDIVHYPRSNKVGIIVHNQSSQFYQEDDQTDYYEGE